MPISECNKFVFIDNSLQAASVKRGGGKQGGSYTVRSHVSKRSKRGKTGQEGLRRLEDRNVGTTATTVGTNSVEDVCFRNRLSEFGSRQRMVATHDPSRLQGSNKSSKEHDESHDREHIKSSSGGLTTIDYIGGRQLDPFASFPCSNASSNSHDNVNHLIYEILPQVIGDDMKACNILRGLTMVSPAFFHALVYGGIVHRDLIKTGVFDVEAPIALHHKVIAIKELAKVVTDEKQASEHEIIFTISSLALHERNDMELMPPGDISPFDSPLKSGQVLDLYGFMDRDDPHVKVMFNLMKSRGGLASCGFFAYLWCSVVNDTIASTNSLMVPYFAAYSLIKHKIDPIISWSQTHSTPTAARLGAGFNDYQAHGIHPHMMYLIKCTAALTFAIDRHHQNTAFGLTLQEIYDARTTIQHTLLALTPQSDLQGIPYSASSFYEPIRLATLIYSIGIVYPVPNPWRALQKLVNQLEASIARTPMLYDRENADLLLWMLVLGGIGASGKQERPWYVAQLAIFAEKHQVMDWTSVEKIMNSLLWLRSACQRSGMLIWAEVVELLVLKTATNEIV